MFRTVMGDPQPPIPLEFTFGHAVTQVPTAQLISEGGTVLVLVPDLLLNQLKGTVQLDAH